MVSTGHFGAAKTLGCVNERFCIGLTAIRMLRICVLTNVISVHKSEDLLKDGERQ
jgi:hypothetical protein